MFNLLDAAIDATASGPVILSEQHDAQAINWVAGLSDPGEMIACGYLPQLRRLGGEKDADYLKRITPLVAVLPQHEQDKIKGAALARAGLDTSNGRVGLVYVSAEDAFDAWHALGIKVDRALDSTQAGEMSGLYGWTVDKKEALYNFGGNVLKADGYFLLVRSDTGAVLGQCKAKYRPTQNAEAFRFIDAVVAKYGARYYSAGSLHGGKKVFMQILLPEHCFEVVRGDRVETFGTFTNPHDNSGSGYFFPTRRRAICANTVRQALRDKRKGIAIPHTGKLSERVAAAQKAVGLAVQDFETGKAQAEAFARTQCPDATAFFNATLDQVLSVTLADMATPTETMEAVLAITDHEQREKKAKEIDREKAGRTATLEEILDRWHSPKNGNNGIRGTYWSTVNAVTEQANHANPSRKIGTIEEQQSRRFDSVLTGERDALNQAAWATAAAAIAG